MIEVLSCKSLVSQPLSTERSLATSLWLLGVRSIIRKGRMYSAESDPLNGAAAEGNKKGRKTKIALIVLSTIVVLLLIALIVLFVILSSTVSQLQSTVGSIQQTNAYLQIQTDELQTKTEFIGSEINAVTKLVLSNKAPCTFQCFHGGYPDPTCTTCKGCGSGWNGTYCNIPTACSDVCTSKECTCQHGGTLNPSTCSCSCLAGWKGDTCAELDNSVSPQQRVNVLQQLKLSALQKQKELRDQVADSPIQSRVGDGVDMALRVIGLPVLELAPNGTQTIIAPSGTIYVVPDGASYNEVLGGLDWAVRDTFVFEHFYDYVYSLFEWSNNNGGYIKPMLQDITLAQIRDKYFDQSAFMAMSQAYYGAYEISLSKSSPLSYSLEEHAQRAIDYISTLPFNQQNKQVYYYFIQNWGTSVITDEIEGGLLQYVCITQSAVWSWGGQGLVSQGFVKQQMDAMFRDTMHSTSYASPVMSQNSICEFFCVGGNPEQCPTPQTANNSPWPGTIWTDPQTIKLNVVPLPEVIADNDAKQSIQYAIYAYYEDQISQYSQFEACSTCLPTMDAFVVAVNVPFETATTVAAGTCSTGIRVVAWGSCTFIMTDNGSPINGGTGDCLYTNEALWGVAAVYGMTAPIVEWIVTDVTQAHTFVSSKCDYPDIECDYWTGHMSIFCV